MTKQLTNEEAFVSNSTYARHHIKRRVREQNLIIYRCGSCNMGPAWNGKELVLQLDHINGKNDDHRLENLRFLCPNCHSQEDTYAARNKLNPERSKKGYYKDGIHCNVK